MVSKRKGMLLVAVLAIGLFVLPSTLSMFAGQHNFYTYTAIPCYKCHQMEYSELDVSIEHNAKECQDCHQVTQSDYPGHVGETLGWVPYFNNTTQHAAISVECIACHTNVPAELLNSSESHRPFFLQSNNTASGWQVLEGSNEACVLCHTHAGVNITFDRRQGMQFTASINDTGYWTFGDLTVYGTNYTYSNSSYYNGTESPTH